MFPDMTPESFESSGAGAQISAALTKLTVDQAMAGAEAASLIFAHTILDDLATSILGFLADAQPDQWEEKVRDRKLSLADSKQSSFAELRDRLVRDYVAQLSKDKSLPKRIGMAFKESNASRELITDFSYDEGRMEKLDELRHSFIHKDALGTRIPTLDDDLNFMHRTGIAMLAAVSLHLSVQASPLRFLRGPATEH
jgi:hypothetical protein